MAQQWYVVQVYSGFEYKVRDQLLDRLSADGTDAALASQFGDILIPTEDVVEIRGEKERRSERKFFPGYILISMEITEDSWHLVNNIPRVVGFLGGNANKPVPIHKHEVDRIISKVQEGAKAPKPKVLYEPGEVIRVIDGPFRDFSGVVEYVDYEKNNMQVEVQILGRSTPVELAFSQVAKS